MRKMIVVAVREYQAAVKTKAFVISMVMMPIFMVGSIVVQKLMDDRVDTTDKRFAVVDRSGVLYETVAAQADARNAKKIFDDEGAQNKPRFLVEQVEETDEDPASQLLALSNRVRDKEIYGFVIIGRDVVAGGEESEHTAISYHSNSATYFDFERWVSSKLNDRIQSLRLTAANLDPTVVAKATKAVDVENMGLVSLDESGHISDATSTSRFAGMLLPLGMMMLMFMVVMIGAQPLMQSVLEEKQQRIAEVLLGSVGPFELMMGKLLGTVGVSLTMAIIYLGGAFYALQEAGFSQYLPVSLVWWFLLFQALAVLLFGAFFAAIGAAVSDLKEAQTMMMPVMILVMAPLFVWTAVVEEPMSSFSTAISLIPPATPMLMVLRLSTPAGIPLWQPMLGVLLVTLTTIAVVFAAGRIFRVGILIQGKGASFGQLVRWALRG